VYGVYVVNNSIFDIGVMIFMIFMIFMGWLGYFKICNRIPAAPLLIAFILGPLLEDNIRQAMLMSSGSPMILFRSPITWIFWALTAITFAALIRTGMRQRAEAALFRES